MFSFSFLFADLRFFSAPSMAVLVVSFVADSCVFSHHWLPGTIIRGECR